MAEKVCRDCGKDGPFRSYTGTRCVDCYNAYQRATHGEAMEKWRAEHPTTWREHPSYNAQRRERIRAERGLLARYLSETDAYEGVYHDHPVSVSRPLLEQEIQRQIDSPNKETLTERLYEALHARYWSYENEFFPDS